MGNYPVSRKLAKESNCKFYFTNKECSKGHLSERRTSTGSCIACEKISHKPLVSYYERNKEKVKARVAEYKLNNPEKVSASQKLSYQKNKDKYLAQQREYRKKNHDVIKERNKNYYNKMSDEKKKSERKRLREYNSKKYWENPELFRARGRKYHHKNRDKILQKLSIWKEINPDWNKNYRQLPHAKEKARFFASRRRAIKAQAIPRWANIEAIELIYSTCPAGSHVDHIVPLVSKIVCGLHCEQNLRHLNAKDNHSKGNHWWPDMP